MTDHACFREVLGLAGARWTAPTLVSLCAGRMRFGQIHKALPGVAQRWFALRLDLLAMIAISVVAITAATGAAATWTAMTRNPAAYIRGSNPV